GTAVGGDGVDDPIGRVTEKRQDTSDAERELGRVRLRETLECRLGRGGAERIAAQRGEELTQRLLVCARSIEQFGELALEARVRRVETQAVFEQGPSACWVV